MVNRRTVTRVMRRGGLGLVTEPTARMVKLDLVVKGSYWWDKRGTVYVDLASVESIEQCYDRNPGGNYSAAYTLVTTRTGQQHKVYGTVEDVARKLGVGAGD